MVQLFGIPAVTVKAIAFWAFVIAFAIKVPVWPFHTWLPDAHTEAPTAGSMILAGVLLKLGAYGFLRLVLPLYPAEAKYYAGWLAVLATLAIIFGALGAYGQDDFKRLVAYSSINHMGFVVLGIAAAAWAAGTENAVIALNGAVLQMFNHGLSAAGMFFLVGVIYDRTHTRDLNAFGGLFAAAAGLRRDPDLHRHGLAGAARSGRVCLRVPGGAGRLACVYPGDGAQHDRPVLHRRLHAESAEEGASRAAERALGRAPARNQTA